MFAFTKIAEMAVGGAQGASDQGSEVAIGPGGNIYVVGFVQDAAPNSDIWIGKFTPSLVMIASVTSNSAGINSDGGNAIAVDNDGNVFITGTVTNVSNSDSDILIAKYTSNLVFVSSVIADGTGTLNDDNGNDIAVDNLGNVYVAGLLHDGVGGGNQNAFVSKYSANTLTFISSVSIAGSSPGGNDQAYGVTLNPAGSEVYVAGFVTDLGGNSGSAFIAKYNSSLVFQSSAVFTAPGDVGIDQAYEVVYADDDYLYAAGSSSYSVTGRDLWVAQFDPANLAGGAIASTNIDGSLGDTDRNCGYGIDVYGDDVYVSGTLTDAVEGWDIFVAKFETSALTLLSSFTVSGSGSTNDQATGLISDGNGSVYVAGYQTGANADIWLAKYAPEPTASASYRIGYGHGYTWEVVSDAVNTVWLAVFDAGVYRTSLPLPGMLANSEVEEYDIAFEDDGSQYVYVTGAATSAVAGIGVDMAVYKYLWSDPTLTLDSSATYNNGSYNSGEYGMSITTDSSGIWIAGAVAYDDAAESASMALWKYDTNLGLAGGFPKLLDVLNSKATDVKVSGSDVWAVGYSSSVSTGLMDLVLWKYDTSGTLQGTYKETSYATSMDVHTYLEIVSDGVWVAANKEDEVPESDIAVLKFDNTGAVVAQDIWRNDDTLDDIVTEIKIDSSGDLLIGGGTNDDDDAAIIHYDVSAGTFTVETTGSGLAGMGLAVDGSGNKWFALEGSSFPYRFGSEAVTPVAGTEGFSQCLSHFTGTFSGDGAVYDCEDYDIGTSVAVDPDGAYVYAVGITSRGATGLDAVIIRYDAASGAMLSSAVFDGGYDDYGYDVAIGPSNVYMLVATNGDGNGNYIVKYSDALEQIGNPGTIENPVMRSMITGSDGNIYTVGDGDGAYIGDIRINQINAANLNATATGYYNVDTTGNDKGFGLAMYDSNTLYVTGTSLLNDTTRFITIKVNAATFSDIDPAVISSKTYEGTGATAAHTEVDWGIGPVVDVNTATGDVYLTGTIGDPEGNMDWLIIRYDSSFNEQGRYVNEEGHEAVSVKVNQDTGDVYVGGNQYTGTNDDIVVAKFYDALVFLSSSIFATPGDISDEPGSIAIDTNTGKAYMSGMVLNNEYVASTWDMRTMEFDLPASVGSISGVVTHPHAPSDNYIIGVSTAPGPYFETQITTNVVVASGLVSAYTISNLPAPATYYVTAFVDYNNNQVRECHDSYGEAEPNGAYGAVDGHHCYLNSQPVFVDASASVTDIDIDVWDFGNFTGMLSETSSQSGDILMIATHSTPGSFVFHHSTGVGMYTFSVASSPVGNPYQIIAAIDSNSNGEFDSGVDHSSATLPTVAIGNAEVVSQDFAISQPPGPSDSLAIYASGADIWQVISDAAEENMWIAKYDATTGGVQVASAVIPGAREKNWDIVFDGGSSVYLAGTSTTTTPSSAGLDVAVYKFSSDAVFESSYTYNSASNLADYGTGIAYDTMNQEIWVSATLAYGSGVFKLGLIKLSDTLGELGVYTYGAGGGVNNMALDIGMDSSMGEIFVVGFSSNGTSGFMDLALWKYDTSGNLDGAAPVTRENYVRDAEGEAYIYFDVSGSEIWIAASRANSTPDNDIDIALLKYDTSKTMLSEEMWHNQALQGNDVVTGVDMDGSGEIWVGGMADDDQGGSEQLALWHYDQTDASFTAKTAGTNLISNGFAIDGSANEKWFALDGSTFPYQFPDFGAASFIDGSTGEDTDGECLFDGDFSAAGGATVDCNYTDVGVATVLDEIGAYVYSVGYASRSTTGNDVVIVKYDTTDGSWVSSATFNAGPGGVTDYATDMTIDSSGNLYIAGGVIGLGNYILKYTSDLVFVSSVPDNGQAILRALDFDHRQGKVFGVGNSTDDSVIRIIGYSSDLSPATLETGFFDAGSFDVELGFDLAIDTVSDPSDLYVTGTVLDVNTTYYVIAKYNATDIDSMVASHTVSGYGSDPIYAMGDAALQDHGLAVDNDSGNVYLIGTVGLPGSNKDPLIVKYNNTLGIISSTTYPAALQGLSGVIGPDGDLYVSGVFYNTVDDDWQMLRFDSNLVWKSSEVYESGGGGDYPGGANIAVDSSGNMYVAGSGDNDMHTIKFALGTGDGGSATITISGTVSYSGAQTTGNLVVVVSTQAGTPYEAVIIASDTVAAVSDTWSEPYSIGDLPAPNTFYIMAFRDVDFDGNYSDSTPYEPGGTYGGHSVHVLQPDINGDGVYLEASDTGIDFSISDTGRITGTMTKTTLQTGATMFKLTVGSDYFIAPANPYTSYEIGMIAPDTYDELKIFMDVNENGAWDASEAYGTAANVTVAANAETSGTNITIADPVLDHSRGSSEVVISSTDFEEVSLAAAFNGTDFLMAWNHWLSGSPGTTRARIVGTDGDVSVSSAIINMGGSSPLVAFGDNEFLMVWGDDTDDPNNHIVGHILTAAGAVSGSPIEISSITGVNTANPQVAFDGTNYVVAWVDTGADGGGSPAIKAIRVNTSGSVLDSGTPTTIRAANPDIFANDIGLECGTSKCLVVWAEGSSKEYVQGQLIDTSGAIANSGSMIDIDIDGDPSDNPFGMAFDGTNFLVAWHDEGATWDLNAAFVALADGSVDNAFTIANSGASEHFPVAVWTGSNYLIMWTDSVFASTGSVKQRYYNASGSALSSVESKASIEGTKAAIGLKLAVGGGKVLSIIVRADEDAWFENPDVFALVEDIQTGGCPAGNGFTGSDFSTGFTFDGGNDDWPNALLMVDTDENGSPDYFYVVAESSRCSQSNNGVVYKYDSAGSFVSSDAWNMGAGSTDEYFVAVTDDEMGGVFVAGGGPEGSGPGSVFYYDDTLSRQAGYYDYSLDGFYSGIDTDNMGMRSFVAGVDAESGAKGDIKLKTYDPYDGMGEYLKSTQTITGSFRSENQYSNVAVFGRDMMDDFVYVMGVTDASDGSSPNSIKINKYSADSMGDTSPLGSYTLDDKTYREGGSIAVGEDGSHNPVVYVTAISSASGIVTTYVINIAGDFSAVSSSATFMTVSACGDECDTEQRVISVHEDTGEVYVGGIKAPLMRYSSTLTLLSSAAVQDVLGIEVVDSSNVYVTLADMSGATDDITTKIVNMSGVSESVDASAPVAITTDPANGADITTLEAIYGTASDNEAVGAVYVGIKVKDIDCGDGRRMWWNAQFEGFNCIYDEIWSSATIVGSGPSVDWEFFDGPSQSMLMPGATFVIYVEGYDAAMNTPEESSVTVKYQGSGSVEAVSYGNIMYGKDSPNVNWAYVTWYPGSIDWYGLVDYDTTTWSVNRTPIGADDTDGYLRTNESYIDLYARHFLNIASVGSNNYTLEIAEGVSSEIYVNGDMVNAGLSDHGNYNYFDEQYDITSYLHDGRNLIAVRVQSDFSENAYFDLKVALESGSGAGGVSGDTMLNSDVPYGWLSTFNGSNDDVDVLDAIDVDSSSNVYVAGAFNVAVAHEYAEPTAGDAFVRKYNSDGTVVWTSSGSTTSNIVDGANGISVDASGHVFTIGIEAADSEDNILINKYNGTDGSLLKSSSIAAGEWAEANAIYVDNSGNIYAAGTVNDDIWVRKIFSNWSLAWEDTVDGTGNNWYMDTAFDVVADTSGYVYAAGYVGTDSEGENVWVRKYNASNGSEVWTKTYNGPDGYGDDEAQALAVDRNGNVYVAGTESREYAGQGTNIWIRKYDSAGNVQWTKSYDGPSNSYDEGFDIALDSAATHVFVTGYVMRSGESNNVWVGKYDVSDGANLGMAIHNGQSNGDDMAHGVVVDGLGNVSVAGFTYVSGESFNIMVRKFTSGIFEAEDIGSGGIEGTLSYSGSASGILQFRIALATSPYLNATIQSEVVKSTAFPSFAFESLADGEYFIRAYADLNASQSLDITSEPIGAFGPVIADFSGTDVYSPFPVTVQNGQGQTGINVKVCDRDRILFGQTLSRSIDSNCYIYKYHYYDDYYYYFYGKYFGFDGTAGQTISIEMDPTDTDWGSKLVLLGPDGTELTMDADYSGESSARIVDYTLPSTGIYTIIATTNYEDTTGDFDLTFTISGGFAGQVSGTITYGDDTVAGVDFIRLHPDDDVNNPPIQISSTVHASGDDPGAYTFTDVEDGTYLVSCFRDVNGNNMRDTNEPKGLGGSVTVSNGSSETSNFGIGDPQVGNIKGTITYAGAQSGQLIVVFERDHGDGDFVEEMRFSESMPGDLETGHAYTSDTRLTPSTTYTVFAWIDVDPNNDPSGFEAVGSSQNVTVVNGSTTSAVDFTLMDPGQGAAGTGGGITGTVTYNGILSGGTIQVLLMAEQDNEDAYGYTPALYIATQTATGEPYHFPSVADGSYVAFSFYDLNSDQRTQRSEPEGIYQTWENVAPIAVSGELVPGIDFELTQPPTGYVSGIVTYEGSEGSRVIVKAESQGQADDYGDHDGAVIELTVGITTYYYMLDTLANATDYDVWAFTDLNGNYINDLGEPYVMVNNIEIDSTTESGTTVNLVIFDAGQEVLGRIAGDVTYSGSMSSGSIKVRLYDNEDFSGEPINMNNAAAPGEFSGSFNFDGIDIGTYTVNAFRDLNGSGYHDGAFEAFGQYQGVLYVTEYDLRHEGVSITLTDPGGADGPTGTAGASGDMSYSGIETIGTVILDIAYATATVDAGAMKRNTDYSLPLAGEPFDFDNIPDGTYMLRGFIDTNYNYSPDVNEPIARRKVSNGSFIASAVTGQDVTFCDRTEIYPGDEVSGSLSTSDCVSHDREDAGKTNPYADYYSFWGDQGLRVTIDLTGDKDLSDTYMYLLGPSGRIADENDDAGDGSYFSKISDFSLPKEGIYTIIAASYGGEVTGNYTLRLNMSAGRSGSISGVVSYTGTSGGKVGVGLYDSIPSLEMEPMDSVLLNGPTSYTFINVPSSHTYYIAGFVDTNWNDYPDPGEDIGLYGGFTLPTAIFLSPGQNKTGVDFTIQTSTVDYSGSGGGANEARIRGSVYYTGSESGEVTVSAWNTPYFDGSPQAIYRISNFSSTGTYNMPVAGDGQYYLMAYMDADNNLVFDPGSDPEGVYNPYNEGAEPVYVDVGSTETGVNFTMYDSGYQHVYDPGGGSSVAGEGTASFAPTSVSIGANIEIATMTYVVGSSSLTAGSKVAFKVPPFWPWPYSMAHSTQAAAGSDAVAQFFAAGDGVVYEILSGTLNAGSTVFFIWPNVWIDCGVEVGTVTFPMASVSDGDGFPQPLSAGEPTTVVNSGQAAFLNVEPGYMSMITGSTSPVTNASSQLLLKVKDHCFNTVATGQTFISTLTARYYDYVGYTEENDENVFIATSAAGAYSQTEKEINFAVGQSSRPVYFIAKNSGYKNIKIQHAFDQYPNYMSLNVIQGAGITEVSVSSSAATAVDNTTLTITPNGDGLSDFAFIHFTVGDPNVYWRVLVSSLAFREGEEPLALWESWGQGDPFPGQIVWSGNQSYWINYGRPVSAGVYYVRIEMSGGGVKNDSIRVTVDVPELEGNVYDAANSLIGLSNAGVKVWGSYGGGRFTKTDSRGDYSMPGLADGTYTVEFEKPGYIMASTQVVVAGSTTFNFGMSQASGLRLTAYVASGSTQPYEQWGDIEVYNADWSFSRWVPIHVDPGTTTVDTGSMWDPAAGQRVTRQRIRIDVEPDTYTVVARLWGYAQVSTSVYVGSGLRDVALDAFSRRANITGNVYVENDVNVPQYGLWISVEAMSSSTETASGYGGAYLQQGQTSGAYTIYGLEPGDYTFMAHAPGADSVSSNVTVGVNDMYNVDLPTMTTGGEFTGAFEITASTADLVNMGNNNTDNPGYIQGGVSVWSPTTYRYGWSEILIASTTVDTDLPEDTLSSTFTISGLDPGDYYIDAYMEGDTEVSPDPSNPRTATYSGSTVDIGTISFTANTGTLYLTVVLPTGQTDFDNVILTPRDLLRPEHEMTPESLTSVFDLVQVDGMDTSSATYQLTVGTEELEVAITYLGTGSTLRRRVSTKDGETRSMSINFRGIATYQITGTITNNISNTSLDTIDDFKTNGGYWYPEGFPIDMSTTTARVEAIRRDFSDYNAHIFDAKFDRVNTRVGYIADSGTYTITGVVPGSYLVRTIEVFDSSGTLVVPSLERVVSVSTNVSNVNFTLSDGYYVSGTVSLADDVEDSRYIYVTVKNQRGEIVRSTFTSIGNPQAGSVSNSVTYRFSNLPSGEFYLLEARDSSWPIKYVSAPLRVPGSSTSGGLSANMSNQDIELEEGGALKFKLRDSNSGLVFTSRNKTTMPSGFIVFAEANPWVDGGYIDLISTANFAGADLGVRDMLGSTGELTLGPLIPDVAYDLHLRQDEWDIGLTAQGSQNFAPKIMSGLVVSGGETKDLGTIDLTQGVSLTGTVKDSLDNLLSNIEVIAEPVGIDIEFEAVAFTDYEGEYELWVSSHLTPQYDVTAAPRERGDETGFSAATADFAPQTIRVNLSKETTANFILDDAPYSVIGRVVTEDGGTLEYPFGEEEDFPGASVHLQAQGVPPAGDDPLGDIEIISDTDGTFIIHRLSTGVYTIIAAGLNYSLTSDTVTLTAVTVGANNELDIGDITISRGATITGTILKVDPTSNTGYSAPSDNEIYQILAASDDFAEYVVGQLIFDPVSNTVSKYSITGLKPNISYSLAFVAKGNQELVFPDEGLGVTFTTSESTATKTVNLTYKPNEVLIDSDMKAVGNDRFMLEFKLSKPMRNMTDLDSDLDLLITVSTCTQDGTALVGDDGTGTLTDKSMGNERKKITAIYTAAASELRFTMRIQATISAKDATTGGYITIDERFDFYTGITVESKERVTNMKGGEISLGSSGTEDERTKIVFGKGTFVSTTSLTADATTQVEVGARRGASLTAITAQGMTTMDVVRKAVMVPGALPRSMHEAMTRVLQEASPNPMSSFYDIFLPASIRNQLNEKATLTLSYNPDLLGNSGVDSLNVWYYNPASQQYEVEADGRAIDTTNNTISCEVDHLSVFVVLASTPVYTSTSPFTGGGMEVYNFPNPFNLKSKTVSLNATPGSGSYAAGQNSITTDGTVIRFGLPSGIGGDVKIKIYDVTGDLIREISNGHLSGGFYYYQVWDGKNDYGKKVASGVYIGQVKVGSKNKFFKMAVIR
ncbi:hypothetical protein ACFL6Y_07195 [Elusimicrobiota bacterium]